MSQRGTLFLIPVPLGEGADSEHQTPAVTNAINRCRTFVAENAKMARRCLKRMGITTPLPELTIHELNEHTQPEDTAHFLDAAKAGEDMGLLSDAGCPGVADPGAWVVEQAHVAGIKVVPLVGPSSLLLALMASGFNGQQFAFRGYLPREPRDRVARLRELDKKAHSGETQIFIETPYRNEKMLEDLLRTCRADTRLCVACDLSLPSEWIRSAPIRKWKGIKTNLHKRPAVFLLGT